MSSSAISGAGTGSPCVAIACGERPVDAVERVVVATIAERFAELRMREMEQRHAIHPANAETATALLRARIDHKRTVEARAAAQRELDR